MEVGRFNEGQYFGGRALFEEWDFILKGEQFPEVQWGKFEEGSLLSIIADSPVVELLYMDKALFS